MTLAATLAKRALRLIPAPIPPAAKEPLRAMLGPRLAAGAAVMALADRFNYANASFRPKGAWSLAAPPITDDEWLQLAELMAAGTVPLVFSLPGIERAILAKAAIKAKEIEPKPVPRWRLKRRERDAARRAAKTRKKEPGALV